MFHLSFYPFEGWTDRRMDYSTSLSIALADSRVGIRPTFRVTNRPVRAPQPLTELESRDRAIGSDRGSARAARFG